MRHQGSDTLSKSRPVRWLLGLLALWLVSGAFMVRPEEQGVVRLFGRVVGRSVQPGLHWRPPWPLTRLNKLRVNEARRVSVGFELADEATGAQPGPGRGQFVTGDQNILNLQLVVQYCVEDPAKYLFRAADIDRLVASASEAALARSAQDKSVDYVLTAGRTEIQETVRKQTAQTLAAYDVGVRLVSSSIKSVYPPAEVSDAFKAVASARGDRDRIIDEARGYLNEVVEKARGEAAATLRESEAYRRRIVAEAEGNAGRFRKVRAEYAKAKQVTRTRLYVEAMEEIVPKMEVIVSDSAGGARPLDLGIIRAPTSPGTEQSSSP